MSQFSRHRYCSQQLSLFDITYQLMHFMHYYLATMDLNSLKRLPSTFSKPFLLLHATMAPQ